MSDLRSLAPGLPLSLARQVMAASFLLSQGDPRLQENLFHYIHEIRPSWEINDVVRRDLEKRLQPVRTLIRHGTHEPDIVMSELKGVVKNAALDMQAILNGEECFEYDGLPVIGEIITQVIERDYRYLVRLGQRVRGTWDSQQHLLQYTLLYRAAKDASLSHLCHFGVLGQDTGLPEFNQMFDEIRGHLRGSDLVLDILARPSSARVSPGTVDRSYGGLLAQVVAAYDRTHYDFVYMARPQGIRGELAL